MKIKQSLYNLIRDINLYLKVTFFLKKQKLVFQMYNLKIIIIVPFKTKNLRIPH